MRFPGECLSAFPDGLTRKRMSGHRSNAFPKNSRHSEAATVASAPQGTCAITAHHTGSENCAPHTEKASGEDLQRCSVQDFATTTFGARVWPKSLTASGSRLELRDVNQGVQDACSRRRRSVNLISRWFEQDRCSLRFQ